MSSIGNHIECIEEDLELPFHLGQCNGGRRLISNTGNGAQSRDMHSSADMPDFLFPKLEHLPINDGSVQMTDLTNSLPRQDVPNLSAQSILAKLDCTELSNTLNPSLSETLPDDSHPDVESDLISSVYEQYNNINDSVSKASESMDIYGKITSYNGKIVLQLRLLNLNTNFPINVTECWLCKNKVHCGSQIYSHKHTFQGMFCTNDEYMHVILPEAEQESDKNVMHSSGMSLEDDQSSNIIRNLSALPTNSTNYMLEHQDDPLESDDPFTLPYMVQAFGLDDKLADSRQNINSVGSKCSSVSYNQTSTGHDIHSAVDNIYNMCSNSNISRSGCTLISDGNRATHQTKEPEGVSFHTLNTVTPKKSNGDRSSNVNTAIKKTEIGAKKRKSKAQKKPSVIRMKGDLPPLDREYFISNFADTNSATPVQLEQTTENVIEETRSRNECLTTSPVNGSGEELLQSNCSDAAFLQESQRQLNTNYKLLKGIISKAAVSCKFCKKNFGRNLASYKKHMVNEHEEPENSVYECPVCSKKFAKNKHLVQHVKIHLGIKDFKCDKCGTTYGREETLKRHLVNHSKKRPYSCSICPKSFARSEYLNAHMQAHNRTKHICEKCGVVCSSKFNLDIHLKKHLKEKPFACELCNKSFVRSDFRDNHMEVAHKRNKPKCNVCGKLFSRRDVLKRHEKLHKKPTFDCKFCLKSFSRKDRLVAHKRTHEISSEIKCSKCPAAFNRRDVLLKHEKLHDIKEQCHLCFKFAPTKEKLLIHLNWHQKEKSTKEPSKDCHTCETCGKILTRKDLLKKHIKRVHGRPVPEDGAASLSKRDKSFVCDICQKGFTRSCNLRSHVLKAHTLKSHIEEDEEDLDSLNTALSRSRQSQSNLVDLSSWTSKTKPETQSSYHTNSCNIASIPSSNNNSSGHTSSGFDNSKDWYPRVGSVSPPHLPSNLSLPQLSSQHQHSPINLSAEAITAAAYLLAYPSYLGPY